MSEVVEDHIELTSFCLDSFHKQEPKGHSYLAPRHLPLYFQYLQELPAFTKPMKVHNDHYSAVKQLVVKIAGAGDLKTLSAFLKSLFPRALRISWKSIFNEVDILKCQPSTKQYGNGLLKLFRKFTGGNIEEFFETHFPEVLPKSERLSQATQDLKKLCNNIVDLRNKSESNEHILNFRRSVISCFVSSFEVKDMQKAGWRINKVLWERCKRKREEDEAFLDVDPCTKRGRKPIGQSLKKEIERLWYDNSREGALVFVTNPKNRGERKVGRRLTKPARHVIIQSSLYKDKRVSYGTIWGYRLWWVVPPTMNDGLCHWCMKLRDNIAYIHKHIPQTDPTSDEGKQRENRENRLTLWKPNNYPETAENWITLIRSKYEELKPNEKPIFKWRINSRLVAMKKLEHHFRLQRAISSREKQLDEDMPTDLLRIWTDFMTPVTIGKGGLKGEESSTQPHNLALVSVHGLMLQYRDPAKTETTEASYAFSINLCKHATKTSYFTNQHILHGLNQPGVKKIFDDRRFKRIEFTFDCASTYQSQEMVYNLTKGFALEMLPRRFKTVRFSPQCHCHGRSNLDRRFSSLTTWRVNWENDEFHDTITDINTLYECYIEGRDLSNQGRISIEHKDPIITDISIITLQPDTSDYRPYVKCVGLKSTNSVSLVTTLRDPTLWRLYNNVLPQIKENLGEDLTSNICDGTKGKPVTAKMRVPGSARKTITTAETDSNPDVIMSQHRFRCSFIRRGNLFQALDAIDIYL